MGWTRQNITFKGKSDTLGGQKKCLPHGGASIKVSQLATGRPNQAFERGLFES